VSNKLDFIIDSFFLLIIVIALMVIPIKIYFYVNSFLILVFMSIHIFLGKYIYFFIILFFFICVHDLFQNIIDFFTSSAITPAVDNFLSFFLTEILVFYSIKFLCFIYLFKNLGITYLVNFYRIKLKKNIFKIIKDY